MEPTPGRQWSKTPKTYNTGDSLVVTDPTTDPALASLTRGERTGSRVFWQVWSYVIVTVASRSFRVDSKTGWWWGRGSCAERPRDSMYDGRIV